MATRYDSAKLRKAHKTPEGALFSEAIFARDGVLEYRLAGGGTRRELRLPETNYDEDTLTSYGSKPVTVEHPPVLVTADNAKNYQVGASDAEPIYERRYDKGFVGGVVRIWHQDGVDAIERNGKREVSIGYTCDVEDVSGIYYPSTGTYVVTDAVADKKGERFDAIQRNVRVNHIALTTKGRAGPEVCLRGDSDDGDVAVLAKPFEFRNDEAIFSTTPEQPSTPKPRMATIRIDNMDFGDVPETVAVLMNQKLNELQSVKARIDALEVQIQDRAEQFDDVRDQIDELTDERDRERGRADALEIQLAEAEMRIDATPTKKKKKAEVVKFADKWEEDEEEDDDEEEAAEDEEEAAEDEEEMEPKPLPNKGKKKLPKKDSVDAKALFIALADANTVVPGLITQDKFDSLETPTDVRRLAVEALAPNVDLTGRSDAYVDGVYDFLKTQQVEQEPNNTQRTDSINNSSYVGSHTPPSQLCTAINQSRANNTNTSPLQGAQQKQRELYMNSWKQPLDLV